MLHIFGPDQQVEGPWSFKPVAFVPCGHTVDESCGQMINTGKCPHCRAPINPVTEEIVALSYAVEAALHARQASSAPDAVPEEEQAAAGAPAPEYHLLQSLCAPWITLESNNSRKSDEFVCNQSVTRSLFTVFLSFM